MPTPVSTSTVSPTPTPLPEAPALTPSLTGTPSSTPSATPVPTAVVVPATGRLTVRAVCTSQASPLAQFVVLVDGQAAGLVACNGTLELTLGAGHHTLGLQPPANLDGACLGGVINVVAAQESACIATASQSLPTGVPAPSPEPMLQQAPVPAPQPGNAGGGGPPAPVRTVVSSAAPAPEPIPPTPAPRSSIGVPAIPGGVCGFTYSPPATCPPSAITPPRTGDGGMAVNGAVRRMGF
jgi:hypothetical protein